MGDLLVRGGRRRTGDDGGQHEVPALLGTSSDDFVVGGNIKMNRTLRKCFR
ncbi:MAG: hypothetical protein AVDCRST_MAG07-2038 [uncultured Frankineae bacterium]|uniref:Uncharacterized protein n=1 Tax=uncultured Frankineae bacterium TaxID=437475 RepID=A0A6J4LCM1_9ACTN|nr:MAG: hypothetical protein AVDCRST_MAG07-2038 [uncultured Frankineae bacterium]